MLIIGMFCRYHGDAPEEPSMAWNVYIYKWGIDRSPQIFYNEALNNQLMMEMKLN